MKKLPVDEIQVIPINEEKTIIPLVEQLNGLIDRYNTLYSLYLKPAFVSAEKNPAQRLLKVLENIEKAIDALCLRLTETRFLMKTEGILKA